MSERVDDDVRKIVMDFTLHKKPVEQILQEQSGEQVVPKEVAAPHVVSPVSKQNTESRPNTLGGLLEKTLLSRAELEDAEVSDDQSVRENVIKKTDMSLVSGLLSRML